MNSLVVCWDLVSVSGISGGEARETVTAWQDKTRPWMVLTAYRMDKL